MPFPNAFGFKNINVGLWSTEMEIFSDFEISDPDSILLEIRSTCRGH